MSNCLNKNISRCGSEYVLTNASKVKEEEKQKKSCVGGMIKKTKKCTQSESEKPKKKTSLLKCVWGRVNVNITD